MVMVQTFLKPDAIKAYRMASELSDHVWDIVANWDWFNKRTLGVQFVTAVDSVGGNLAEGFGRYHKKDKEKFYYNARGSVYESIFWIEKAKKRKLLNEKEYGYIATEMNNLPREINWLIKITEEKLKI